MKNDKTIEQLLAEKNKQDVQNYIDEVLSNKVNVGRLERLSVERFSRDMKNPAFYFDWDAANSVLLFIQLKCKHVKGALTGKQIKLEPWQKFFLAQIYGWKNTATNKRRVRKVYLQVARKNAKTTILSSLSLYHLLELDGEKGAEVFSIASKREQAKISWDIAKSMVQSSDYFSNRIVISQSRLTYNTSFFTPLASEDKSSDGWNPNFVIVDEYHQHPTDGMLNAMISGTGSREEPIIFIITTAGFDVSSPCYAEYERAVRILEGTSVDDTYLSFVYQIDEGDDYKNPAIFRKANPNLGVSVYEDFLSSRLTEVIDSPAKLNDFKTKNLNIWQNSVTRWIDYMVWQRNTGTFDANILKGRTCYAGLDLSTNLDLTAIALDFPPEREGEKHKKLYHFWLPSDGIVEKEREDKVPYRLWAEQGYLTLTDGAVIDYAFVAEKIKQYTSLYNLRLISADRYRLLELVRIMPELEDLFIEFSQGLRQMSPASLEYERLIKQGAFESNNNPILNWMIMNAEVKLDENSNIKVVKPKRDKTGKRIDGVIADIMATYTAITENGNAVSQSADDMIFFF